MYYHSPRTGSTLADLRHQGLDVGQVIFGQLGLFVFLISAKEGLTGHGRADIGI